MTKLQIDLLGTSFTIQANEDSEYLEKLVSYYSRITADIQKTNSIRNPMQIAILSGIMLCDELYKEKENKIALENNTYEPIQLKTEEEVNRKTKEMIDKINKVL
ncbi:MAG: cell division protein ZapA [Treponema sp.]|nr:cell division protein ZapA [Treponema sp.]